MREAIADFFLNKVGRELCVFFCSLIPVIECRGAVPLGCALGLPWWQTFLLAVAGNLLPVPFILWLIRAILKGMTNSRVKLFNRIAGWLNRKVEKHKGKIEKYSYWGVVLFVAIPIPGTGAWTGSLIAAVLGIKADRAVPVILLGVCIAAAIMTLITYGVIHVF